MSTAASPHRSDPHSEMSPQKIILMGVCGCGKTTIGEALAPELGGRFIDGDRFHPEENIRKMEQGTPLTDADREPWLKIIGKEMAGMGGLVICGCSSLKRAYRDILRKACGSDILFVHLSGSKDLIRSRMGARTGHFMPVSLIDSQFAALEPPQDDETSLTVSIDKSEMEIVADIASMRAVPQA